MLSSNFYFDEKWRIIKRYLDLEVIEIPIYKSRTSSGCFQIIKTLYSTVCKMDCLYCPLREGMAEHKIFWKKDKLVNATLKLYYEGRIRGIFISSTLFGDPDNVVERELEVVETLRRKGFNGYIHLKLMPGVSKDLIERAIELVNRISLNLEAPDEDSFKEIAPSKGSQKLDIFKRLLWTRDFVKKKRKNVSISTQLIHGSFLASDKKYLEITDILYKLGIDRVYYSTFKPFPKTPLGKMKPEEMWRTYRLYQASFLIKKYGIPLKLFYDILDEKENLPNIDPKKAIADMLDIFPIDVKYASLKELILVPGIGIRTAKKILDAKNKGKLTPRILKKILGKRYNVSKKYLKIC